ncbi:MAG: rhodanese-like domain-containing protein [Clostridiales bacterium]|nr:rhodanese-like domain-containing protein [Candidatus Crickella equi]
MKHSRKVFALIMTVAMVFTMSFATVGVSAATKTSGKVGAVKWNKAKKTVSFDVTVNEKMLNGAAVTHFIINDKMTRKAEVKGQKTGKTGNAGAGLFSTKANALDLYDALVKAGATPWVDKFAEDATSFGAGTIKDNVNNGNTAYSKLEMTFKKDGKTYTPQDMVKYKNKGAEAAAPVEMCFTGNYVNNRTYNSGCVACIFSCYVGVTSNQAIGIGTTNEKENYFFASDLLKAGDKYTVTYKIKPNDSGYNYISAGQFNKDKAKYALLDVRPAEKYDYSHIKGAFQASFKEAKNTDETGIAALKAAVKKYGKNNKYVLCCNTGKGFAKAAADVMATLGVKPANVQILCGGFENWKTKFKYQQGTDGNVIVDPVKKVITLDAKVNGPIYMLKDANGNPDKTKKDWTHHLVVNENGSNGKVCFFPTKAKPMDVYNAFKDLGTEEGPGEAMIRKTENDKPAAGTLVEGGKVDVKVSWKKGGKKVTKTLPQIVKRIDQKTGKALKEKYVADMRFGGCCKGVSTMTKPEEKMNISGCITCTFSCWIGTVSNAQYGYSTEEVVPNRSVLPKKGTKVTVTYTVK